MNWKNVKLIFLRELRDQLRDRRTLFMIAVLPLLLYPLMGFAFMQVSQFLKKNVAQVQFLLTEPLLEDPALLDGDKLVPRLTDTREPLSLTVTHLAAERVAEYDAMSEADRLAEFQRVSREIMERQGADAVVVFPKGFTEQLLRLRKDGNDTNSSRAEATLQPLIYYDAAKDSSLAAYRKVGNILDDWREQIVSATLRDRHLPVRAASPFELLPQDMAPPEGKLAALWSKVLPFVVLIWAMTGAFYPAVDLCAGEKERGTLETLLSGPAERIEIVWGKLLTIMVFSVCTAILNLFCLVSTASLIFQQLQQLAPQGAGIVLGPPPLRSMAWLLCGLVPMSALFSALSLAFATMARSTKEGQYYLMPLFLVSMPLMMLAVLPSSQLDLGTSLIPLTGVVLLLRYLIEGQYTEALLYVAPVVAVTAGCCWVAIRWAVDQFNDETVLFRESERFNPSTWIAHLMRDRGPTPSVAEAFLCGILILMLRYFSSMSLAAPQSWNDFVGIVLVSLVAVVATPALLMAVMLTTSPRQTLSLYLPTPWSLGAAALLAVFVHPLALGLSVLIRKLYPYQVDLEAMEQPLAQAPNIWFVLLLIAVLPAICEEIAFRGFILSGLRHMGSKWRALAISSIMFGIAHGVVQQSLLATFIGMFLGYIAIQSGSLFPCMVFHACYNGLTVMSHDWIPKLIERYPQTTPMFMPVDGPTSGDVQMYIYTWPVIVASASLAYLVLRWFRGQPFNPSAEERLREAIDRQMAFNSSLRG